MSKASIYWTKIGLLIASYALSATLSVSPVYAYEPPELPRFARGKILLKLKPGYSVDVLDDMNEQVGVFSIRKKRLARWYSLKIPLGADVIETAEKYEKLLSVEYAGPSYIFYLHITPDDAHFSKQWGLKQSSDKDIDADLAWDIMEGSSTVKVGILDTGVDPDHPDLVNNLLSGYDFVDADPEEYPDWELLGDYQNPDDDPSDDYGHGTHVTGIAGARGNNTIGIAGVNWYSKIVPVRVGFTVFHWYYGYWSFIDTDHADEALDYARAQGCKVINMSWGGWTDSPSLHEAITNAYNAGCVLVASTGNDNADSIRYPARYSEVMAVGATNEDDERCDESDWESGQGSNYGSDLEVVAPGNLIYSTTPTYSVYGGYEENYDYMSGTSMAAPHVSGLAALILSVNENLDDAEVRDITKHADDLGASGWDSLYGWGRINADSALLNTPSLTITPSNRDVSEDAGSTTYTIENEGSLTRDWSVTKNRSWVTVSPTGGTLASGQSQTLTVNYGQNIRTAERTCTITLSYSNYVGSVDVSLTQDDYPPTLSGNLPHDEIWVGNFTLTGDVTVPSGITLTIEPGSEITFPSGKEFYVYGTLLAEGTSRKRIIFDSQSSQNSHIVRFNNSSSSNSSLEYCRFQYANKGIHLYDSDPDIKNCEIEDCYYGIYNNQGRPLIDDNDITDCSYGIYNYNSQGEHCFEIKNNSINYSMYGIYNYSASPDIHSNEMYGGAFGIRCNSNSSPIMCGYYQPGYNYVHDNFMVGLYAESNSNPFLGSDYCCLYGYNSFIDDENELGQVAAGSGCVVIAETNWWGTANPPSGWFSGDVDYIPYLTEPPGGKWKASPEEEAFDIAFGSELPVDKKNSEVTSYFNPDWSLIQQLRFAHILIYNNEPEYAQQICKNVIDNYPDSTEAFFALDLLWQASRLDNATDGHDMDAYTIYLRQLAGIDEKKELYGSAELLLARFEGRRGLSRIERVFKEYWGTFLAQDALFQKFMYYFNEDNIEKARELSDKLDEYFPESSSAIEAHHLLGDKIEGWGKSLSQTAQFEQIQGTTSKPEKFELLGVHSNPFNQFATIKYSVPRSSKIEVIIFNALGQKINDITIASQPVGTHELAWDGTNHEGIEVPSGLYFIHFRAKTLEGKEENFAKSMKLLLLR
jgi:thermitase